MIEIHDCDFFVTVEVPESVLSEPAFFRLCNEKREPETPEQHRNREIERMIRRVNGEDCDVE